MNDKETLKKLEELVDSGLAESSCVLFIGPEFIKFNGLDYNLAFYNDLPESDNKRIDKKKAKYNTDEKIWIFDSLPVKREWYIEFTNYFKQHRDINNPVYRKLASIPFHLIVSLIPDDTLNVAFSQYEDLDVLFKSKSDQEVPEPSKEKLLIYNIYGNIRDREYIASYFDYLNFIMNYERKGFPSNFLAAVIKANYLLFVGFEFDKWYNILLLYILHLIKSSSEKLAIGEQSTEELYKKLSDKSLNIIFVEQNIEQFIDDLYCKTKEKNLLREIMPLKDSIIKKTKSIQTKIEEIKERIELCEPMEKRRLELDIGVLEKEKETLINQLKTMK